MLSQGSMRVRGKHELETGSIPLVSVHEVPKGRAPIVTSADGYVASGLEKRGGLPSIIRAAQALSPCATAPDGGASVSRRIQNEDRQLFTKLMRKDMAGYSIEEIRRFLEVDRPHLSEAYVRDVLAPKLDLDRPIDRFGAEPRFLVAAKLAHHMLGAPVGQTEAQALASFIERDPMLRVVWPELSIADLPRLRAIYPFLPSWESGKKSPKDLSLEKPYDNDTPLEVRVWLQTVLDGLDALAQIPLASPVIEKVNELRGERGGLAGTRILDISHALADKIPMLQSLIAYDGVAGADIRFLCKHYAADDRVMDVMRRVFGVRIERADDDQSISGLTREAVLEAVDGDDRPLLIHMGGVHEWRFIDEVAKAHPEVPIAGVSHTTSDAKDVLEGPDVSIPLEMMSLGPAKQNDERDRFRHSLRALIDRLGHALDEAIYQRRFLLEGYGRIMGPAMAEALAGMGVDFAVNDPAPDRDLAARERGLETVPGIDSEAGRKLIVIGASNGSAMSPEEIEKIEKPAIFIQVQTGREAFPMEWVEEKSKGPDGVPRRQVIGWLGHQPIVEYTLTLDAREVKHTFVSDGYVANLAFPRPAITEYSIFTNVLILESLRQSKWRLDNMDRGTFEERGRHLLETIGIDMTPEKPRRLVTLFDRSARDILVKPLHQVLLSDPQFAELLEKTKDDGVIYRTMFPTAKVAAKRKKVDRAPDLPRPGTYADALGRKMTKRASTDGAWQAVPPSTKTGAWAHAIVSHQFEEKIGKKSSALYDGSLDDKAMRELIEIGKAEGLIEVDGEGGPVGIDRFLDALRPYQLDVVKEGADAIRNLIRQAKSDREFFEVSTGWPPGKTWSDGRANALLIEKLSTNASR
jgi:S-adenosylhomocysteine hydrolase